MQSWCSFLHGCHSSAANPGYMRLHHVDCVSLAQGAVGAWADGEPPLVLPSPPKCLSAPVLAGGLTAGHDAAMPPVSLPSRPAEPLFLLLTAEPLSVAGGLSLAGSGTWWIVPYPAHGPACCVPVFWNSARCSVRDEALAAVVCVLGGTSQAFLNRPEEGKRASCFPSAERRRLD